MKQISIIEKDIELRNRLSQKADDMEVLYDFLSNNQVSESEFQIELEIFSKLIKEFEDGWSINSYLKTEVAKTTFKRLN